MRSTNRICILAVLGYVCMGQAHTFAQPLEFDFEDPKGVNAMTFVLDSVLEPIVGVASGISGKVTFDPANAEAMTGMIRVDVASLHVPHKKMTQVLHSKKWMDVATHPTIEFVFKSVKSEGPAKDNVFDLEIVGDFTCRGITKEITVQATVTYLPGKLAKRMHRGKGDLLVLRSRFSIKRTDFDINTDTPATVVAEDIELRMSIVGLHQGS